MYGELLRDAFATATGIGPRPLAGGRLPRPVIEIIERDDGLVHGAPAAHYLDGPEHWQPYDHRAVDRVRGATLDVGTGAGRVALLLQERGVPVTGLDTSAGALDVCRRRGVRDLVCGTVDTHAADGRRYDTFLLLGNNLGLFEGRERAPAFLAALAALARPGAQVIAQGTNPYGTRDPLHTGYHELNRRRGRLGGQLRLRLRYRDLATGWFDYLVCSPDELAELVRGSAWELSDVDVADAPYYLATLRLAGGPAAAVADTR
ncbi:Methyltransferase domain-containing protein [Micromonospora nigra]|uniref:Methyltransferase domain-containing protein n=1 Tax=Micromonospora nigra TaxID=145857 RepID=A0A1C6S2H9_9ACTN|nr:Methyltransferase domain-containing protein [Micromonospora nigra]